MNNKEFGKQLQIAGKLLEEGKEVQLRKWEVGTQLVLDRDSGWFDFPEGYTIFGINLLSVEVREKPSSVTPAPDTEWWEWRSGDTHQVVGVKYASEEAATKRKPEGGRTLHHVTMKSEHVERKPRECWAALYGDGSCSYMKAKEKAVMECKKFGAAEVIHWREVLED